MASGGSHRVRHGACRGRCARTMHGEGAPMPQHVELIRQSVLCAREPTSTNVRGSCMAGSLMPCWVCVAKCTQQCAVIVTAPPHRSCPSTPLQMLWPARGEAQGARLSICWLHPDLQYIQQACDQRLGCTHAMNAGVRCTPCGRTCHPPPPAFHSWVCLGWVVTRCLLFSCCLCCIVVAFSLYFTAYPDAPTHPVHALGDQYL